MKWERNLELFLLYYAKKCFQIHPGDMFAAKACNIPYRVDTITSLMSCKLLVQPHTYLCGSFMPPSPFIPFCFLLLAFISKRKAFIKLLIRLLDCALFFPSLCKLGEGSCLLSKKLSWRMTMTMTMNWTCVKLLVCCKVLLMKGFWVGGDMVAYCQTRLYILTRPGRKRWEDDQGLFCKPPK